MSDQTEIRKTMSKGTKILIARQFTVQFFSLFSSVILARLLTPQDFGLYAIIGFFLQFLTLLSDGGIGASLIQCERDPDRKTYSAAFTVIQIFYLGACVTAIPGAWLFAHFYRSMSLNLWMIYTFIIEFYLSSFRVIPAAKLERTLQYTRLAAVETLEYFSFQVVTVILAFMRNGVWSFIFGALISRVVGLVLLYVLSPFAPTFTFELSTARPLMRFGAALQLADVLSFIQSSLTPTFVTFKLGPAAVGFSNFARKVGSYPSYPLKAVNRIMFPLLSRIQDDEKGFAQILNDIVRIYNIFLFGTTSVLLGVVPQFIEVVFGSKWIPSVELTYSALIGALQLGFAIPIYAAIQAKGHGKVFLITNSLFALISWSITVPSVLLFGYNGLMAFNVSGLILFPILLAIAKKYVRVRIWGNLWRPACALTTAYATQQLLVYDVRPHTLSSLVPCLLIGGVMYSICTLVLDSKSRKWVFHNLIKLLRHGLRLGEDEHQGVA